MESRFLFYLCPQLLTTKNINVMKKVVSILIAAAMFSFVACKNNKANDEAEKKRIEDSIAKVKTEDSLKMLEQQQMNQVMDSSAADSGKKEEPKKEEGKKEEGKK